MNILFVPRDLLQLGLEIGGDRVLIGQEKIQIMVLLRLLLACHILP